MIDVVGEKLNLIRTELARAVRSRFTSARAELARRGMDRGGAPVSAGWQIVGELMPPAVTRMVDACVAAGMRDRAAIAERVGGECSCFLNGQQFGSSEPSAIRTGLAARGQWHQTMMSQMESEILVKLAEAAASSHAARRTKAWSLAERAAIALVGAILGSVVTQLKPVFEPAVTSIVRDLLARL